MYFDRMPDPWRSDLLNQPMPDMGDTPCVGGPALARRRIALVTTAALHLFDDPPFVPGEATWRTIPDDVDVADLVTSHIAPNFDRTALMEDVNTVFPIARLHDLADDGTVGSAAARHYGFMGSTRPTAYEEVIGGLTAEMARDGVDGVVLAGV